MERKRDGLVPIGEALANLPGPVKALQPSPQARRGFTLADQVHQLVSSSEADPDLGFMARMMALCSLPRTNPGNRLQYVRRNGPYSLVMIAGGGSTSCPSAISHACYWPGCAPRRGRRRQMRRVVGCAETHGDA